MFSVVCVSPSICSQWEGPHHAPGHIQTHSSWISMYGQPPQPLPNQTCSDLLTIKHRMFESRRLTFKLNAFLLSSVNMIFSVKGGESFLLPPANTVCEGYVFTGVCLSTGGVCLWSQGVSATHPRQTHPQADISLGRPPGRPPRKHPLGRHTPRQTSPVQKPPGRHPPGRHPPGTHHPADTHPPSAFLDMVIKWVVHIPLECILVL